MGRVPAHAAITGAARRRLRKAAIPPMAVASDTSSASGRSTTARTTAKGPGQATEARMDDSRSTASAPVAAVRAVRASLPRTSVDEVAMGATHTVRPAARRASARPVAAERSTVIVAPSTPTRASATTSCPAASPSPSPPATPVTTVTGGPDPPGCPGAGASSRARAAPRARTLPAPVRTTRAVGPDEPERNPERSPEATAMASDRNGARQISSSGVPDGTVIVDSRSQHARPHRVRVQRCRGPRRGPGPDTGRGPSWERPAGTGGS